MNLKTLRLRVDHLVYGGLALLLLVGGALGWRALRPVAEEPAELDTRLDRLRHKSGRRSSPRFLRPMRPYRSGSDEARREIGEGLPVFKPPRQIDPGDLGPEEAVDSFKEVLAELEEAVENERVLDQYSQWELYNRATGSFTVLSSWIDGSDPKERALMEDSYQQMRSLMGELELERPPREETRGYAAHGRWAQEPAH